MIFKNCKAKEPKICKYHGIQNAMGGSLNCQEVASLASNYISSYLLKLFNGIERQDVEGMIALYKKDSFLPSSFYLNLKANSSNDDAISNENFKAEAIRQLQELKKSNVLGLVKTPFKVMTKDHKWNRYIRNTNFLVSEEEKDKLSILIEAMDQAYSTTTKRVYPNRLFRGVAFKDKKDFAEWFSNNSEETSSLGVVLQTKEYFRTSTSLSRAYSFASDRKYPVIFEVLTREGIYLDEELSSAPQEKEVLINKMTCFKVEGLKSVIVNDENQQKRVIVVSLAET
jgi:hypothetical protein